MNRKTLIAGAAGAFALAATVAIAQTYQTPSNQTPADQPAASADTSVNAQSADTAATDTAATAGERG